jgi:DNA-binding CsgD family transcriptional regulator
MHTQRLRFEGANQNWQNDRRQDVRRQWERLGHLAGFLEESERELMMTAIDQGAPFARLARLTQRSPSSVRRQMRDIMRRLSGRELGAAVAHPAAFTRFEKACLREHLVRKHTLAEVAAALDTSVYTVRKTIAAVRAKAKRLHCSQRK